MKKTLLTFGAVLTAVGVSAFSFGTIHSSEDLLRTMHNHMVDQVADNIEDMADNIMDSYEQDFDVNVMIRPTNGDESFDHAWFKTNVDILQNAENPRRFYSNAEVGIHGAIEGMEDGTPSIDFDGELRFFHGKYYFQILEMAMNSANPLVGDFEIPYDMSNVWYGGNQADVFTDLAFLDELQMAIAENQDLFAFELGQGSQEMREAYYEIARLIRKYGPEMIMVEPVGEMRTEPGFYIADFKSSYEQTQKASLAFVNLMEEISEIDGMMAFDGMDFEEARVEIQNMPQTEEISVFGTAKLGMLGQGYGFEVQAGNEFGELVSLTFENMKDSVLFEIMAEGQSFLLDFEDGNYMISTDLPGESVQIEGTWTDGYRSAVVSTESGYYTPEMEYVSDMNEQAMLELNRPFARGPWHGTFALTNEPIVLVIEHLLIDTPTEDFQVNMHLQLEGEKVMDLEMKNIVTKLSSARTRVLHKNVPNRVQPTSAFFDGMEAEMKRIEMEQMNHFEPKMPVYEAPAMLPEVEVDMRRAVIDQLYTDAPVNKTELNVAELDQLYFSIEAEVMALPESEVEALYNALIGMPPEVMPTMPEAPGTFVPMPYSPADMESMEVEIAPFPSTFSTEG